MGMAVVTAAVMPQAMVVMVVMAAMIAIVATEVMVVMTAMVMVAMVMDIAVMEATAMGIVMERDTAGAIDVALMSMMLLLLPMSTAIPLSTPLHTALSIPLSIPLPTALSILQYTAKLPLSSLMPITH